MEDLTPCHPTRPIVPDHGVRTETGGRKGVRSHRPVCDFPGTLLDLADRLLWPLKVLHHARKMLWDLRRASS